MLRIAFKGQNWASSALLRLVTGVNELSPSWQRNCYEGINSTGQQEGVSTSGDLQMMGAVGHSTRLDAAVPQQAIQHAEGRSGCVWGKTHGTISVTHATCPALTELLLGLCFPTSQAACLLAGKNFLTSWQWNMLSLKQNVVCRTTHSSSSFIIKAPSVLVYSKEQELHCFQESSFFCVTQAKLAGGRVLENKLALLAVP